MGDVKRKRVCRLVKGNRAGGTRLGTNSCNSEIRGRRSIKIRVFQGNYGAPSCQKRYGVRCQTDIILFNRAGVRNINLFRAAMFEPMLESSSISSLIEHIQMMKVILPMIQSSSGGVGKSRIIDHLGKGHICIGQIETLIRIEFVIYEKTVEVSCPPLVGKLSKLSSSPIMAIAPADTGIAVPSGLAMAGGTCNGSIHAAADVKFDFRAAREFWLCN